MKKQASSFSILVIYVCLSILGLFFVPKLSLKLNPSRKHPIVNIGFSMGGQSARIIESEVTSKLEAMLNRVKGVQGINSKSQNGYGSIQLYLSEHVDPEIARFDISTVIRQAWTSLPDGVSYPSIYMAGTTNKANYPFLRYTVNASASAIDIQNYIDKLFRPALADVKGLEKISISGATRYIYELEYNYKLLQSYGVQIEDIRNSIYSYVGNEFLGIAQKKEGDSEYMRVDLQGKELNDEFNPSVIQVKNQDGKIFYLDQLVTTHYIEEESSSAFRINGLNSIYVSFTASDKSNQLALSEEVKERVSNLEKVLPSGYEVHLIYDEGEYIQGELDTIYLRSGLTVLILLLFVFVVYRNWRYSLVIMLSLLTNLLIASIFYYLLGAEMHLFSLAGLTISLTLIIDNTIIMSDQIVQQGNRKAFMAILTATLTTIASLSIIFLMDKNIQLNLYDFALVIIINLVLSLITAITFVPALIEKIQLTKSMRSAKHRSKLRVKVLANLRPKRLIIYFNKFYTRLILFSSRKWVKVSLIVFIILLFGLPVFMLPDKLGNKNPLANDIEETFAVQFYNKTLGSEFYKTNVKPITDVALGGTLRLFMDKVVSGSYGSGERGETTLHVNASLPNGSTKEQMDNLIKRMENYIAQYPEVRQFETDVQARSASIRILFEKEYQRGGFPFSLQSKLISKAVELGGGSWSIYGVGDGFNNDIREQAGSSRIKLLGYNYDELMSMAEALRDTLLGYRRIKNVIIDSEFNWYRNDYEEFVFNLDKGRLAQAKIHPVDLFRELNPLFQRNASLATWVTEEVSIPITLTARESKDIDIWNLENHRGKIGNQEFVLTDLAKIEKMQTAQNVAKENQEYKLGVQYEYIGSYMQANKVLTSEVESFNERAPLGYKAESDVQNYWWGKEGSTQYKLLLLIIAIMFLTTSILFNSLKQPFVILFIIPISFIGIFLTFYLFNLNFDQGGFAAFILLSGITVNANIYVLNEYNNIKAIHPHFSSMRIYLRAWNAKIRPIFLTIVSTILGFIPFMIGEYKEAFWFPLAAGTIGGLIVSFIALFLFFPLFMGVGNVKNSILERGE